MKKSNSIRVLVGQRIKLLRARAGLSQEALAEKCGLDRTYISGVERGVRNPTLEVLYILAIGLEVDLATLFTFQAGE